MACDNTLQIRRGGLFIWQKEVFLSVKHYTLISKRYGSIWIGFGGFALSQKRKCQISLYLNFLECYPNEKVLEISSTSMLSLGAKLSAMNLKKRTKEGITTVESAFQSSRIYKNGTEIVGPFPEYLYLPGRECKKLVKAASNGWISKEYVFDAVTFYASAHHISLFYDFLYLKALLEPENQEIKEQLLSEGYTAFSDLATKSLNCQARSAAIFVGLVKAGNGKWMQMLNLNLETFLEPMLMAARLVRNPMRMFNFYLRIE